MFCQNAGPRWQFCGEIPKELLHRMMSSPERPQTLCPKLCFCKRSGHRYHSVEKFLGNFSTESPAGACILTIPLPSKIQACFNTFCLTGSRKSLFGTNRVHVRVTDAIIPGFCTESRPGSNGTSPGVKKTIIQRIKSLNFILPV